MDIRNVDLNLIVTLDVLLAEESVSRAAQRLHRTQPAVSAALSRLRNLLEDPLLVRDGGRMSATPFARSLRQPVREIIESVERTLGSRERFAPSDSDRIFRVATSDYAELTVIPAVLAKVRSQAPSVRVELLPIGHGLEEQLGAGDVDLTLADDWTLRHLKPRVALFHETFVCMVARNHPRVGKRMSISRYLAERHMLMSARGIVEGNVDRGLSRIGKRREVVMSVPHFLAIPALIAASDLIVTLPRRVGEYFEQFAPVRTLNLPLDVPGFDVSYAVHRRNASDAGICWLRDQMT